jgi:hypothetical protein
MGLKSEVLKRPYLLAKPVLATVITVKSPHTNGDSACAEQSSYSLFISGMGNRIWGTTHMWRANLETIHTKWKKNMASKSKVN